MRDLYGKDVRFSVIEPRRPLFRRLGLPGVAEVIDGVEARSLWARFGLAAP